MFVQNLNQVKLQLFLLRSFRKNIFTDKGCFTLYAKCIFFLYSFVLRTALSVLFFHFFEFV